MIQQEDKESDCGCRICQSAILGAGHALNPYVIPISQMEFSLFRGTAN